jgi:hypothetical protein
MGAAGSQVPSLRRPWNWCGAGLAERHPELTSEAVEALVWDFGYAHW